MHFCVLASLPGGCPGSQGWARDAAGLRRKKTQEQNLCRSQWLYLMCAKTDGGFSFPWQSCPFSHPVWGHRLHTCTMWAKSNLSINISCLLGYLLSITEKWILVFYCKCSINIPRNKVTGKVFRCSRQLSRKPGYPRALCCIKKSTLGALLVGYLQGAPFHFLFTFSILSTL